MYLKEFFIFMIREIFHKHITQFCKTFIIEICNMCCSYREVSNRYTGILLEILVFRIGHLAGISVNCRR